MEDFSSANRKHGIHPKEKANFLSRALFLWAIPLLFNKEKTEYYRPLNEFNSFELSQRLENEWMRQYKLNKTPSIWKSFINLFYKEMIISGIFYGITKIVIIVLQPIIFSKILKSFTQQETELRANEALYYVLGMIVLQLYQSISVNFIFMVMSRIGLQARAAIISFVYRKSINLRKDQFDQITTIAQLLHFISVDTIWIDIGFNQIHQMWMAPVELLTAAISLYVQFGLFGVSGLSIFVLIILYQNFAIKCTNHYNNKKRTVNEDRIRLLSELITGIQIIKMYSWEKHFKKLILEAKKTELYYNKILTYLRLSNGCSKVFVSSWAMCITIAAASFMKINLSPHFVFVSYIYYNILKRSIGSQFSTAVMLFQNMKNSVDRVETYFRLVVKRDTISSNSVVCVTATNVGINFKNVTVKWNIKHQDPCLIEIDFSVQPKSLTAIIGSSGSGKSALLLTILRETCIVEGCLSVKGRKSYASQEPWIFPASIRQNILFGEDFENEKFWNVIKACGLEHDLSLFPHGDLSLAGERGVLLSGGQKARINLARAIYKNADIYLLDDPLSAVDSHVAKHIFQNCILNFLCDKIVLLVTHQAHILSTMQKVYYLKEGKISLQNLTNKHKIPTNLLKFNTINNIEEEVEKKNLKIMNFKIPDKTREKDQSTYLINNVCRFLMGARINHIYILLIAVFIFTQFLITASDYFMNFWINISQQHTINSNFMNEASVISLNYIAANHYLQISFAIAVCSGFFIVGRAILFGYCCHKSSEALHYAVINRLMCATMSFFNMQKSGMILNKFSSDMAAVDQYFPVYLIEVIQSIISIISAIIFICLVNYVCLLPSVVFIAFLCFMMYRLQPIVNEAKTKGILSKSPIFTHVVVTMEGSTTVRAQNSKEIIIKEFNNILSKHCVACYLKIVLNFLIGISIDLLGLLYMVLVLLFFHFNYTEMYVENIDTIIIQVFSMAGMAKTLVKITSDFTLTALSLARIQEYEYLPMEVDNGVKVPPNKWPEKGRIKFNSVCLRYSSSTPLVLYNINVEIKPKQKIGIIGRTGSGKSSLISTLFRLYDFTGIITIDGVNINQISLKDLRSNVAIIPQNPILFFGSLLTNLDPFKQHNSVQIWQALEAVGMKPTISALPHGLKTRVQESGSNFSSGQRQLLCLARAILQKCKILILDEVTSNLDLKTDQIMQTTIKRKFKNSTLLTISHRLYNVIDSDKVLVLNDGHMVEFDHPYQLLQKPNGYFYHQVHQNGSKTAEELTNLAHKHFRKTYKQTM